MSQLVSVKDILEKSTTYLKGREFVDSPRLEAEMLLGHVLKLKRIELYLCHDRPLKEEELATMRSLLKQRSTGYPMAYLLGYRGFYRSDFLVTPDTLIPRPETELLVEHAIEIVRASNKKDWTICDLGSGTGAIGLSVALELPNVRVVLIEKSAQAAEVCQKNALNLGVQDRVEVLNTEIQSTQKLNRVFDMILANPPYIAESDLRVEPWVRKFEPSQALFCKDEGLYCLKDWIAWASFHVSSGGTIIFEHGDLQGPQVSQIMNDNGFGQMNAIYDLSKKWRHTFAIRK